VITCEELPGSRFPEWEETLLKSCVTPLHRPEVLRLDQHPGDPVFLLLREGDRPVGCALGAGSGGRIARWLGRRELYLPTIPAMREGVDDALREGLEALLGFCRREGYHQLVVDSRWGADLSRREPFSSAVVHRSLEFVLGVDRPPEELLAGMDRYHRKNVRRAEKEGVTVEFETSLEAVLALRDLQLNSADRAGRRGNAYRVREEDYYRRAHEQIYAAGWGEVALARVEGEVVAALAFLRAGERTITVRSGATKLGYERNAMYLLQYEVILRASGNGGREINLGAVPEEATRSEHPQHGLYAFKKGFGGEPYVRTRVALRVPRGVRGDE